jgi:hypothetical protein
MANSNTLQDFILGKIKKTGPYFFSLGYKLQLDLIQILLDSRDYFLNQTTRKQSNLPDNLSIFDTHLLILSPLPIEAVKEIIHESSSEKDEKQLNEALIDRLFIDVSNNVNPDASADVEDGPAGDKNLSGKINFILSVLEYEPNERGYQMYTDFIQGDWSQAQQTYHRSIEPLFSIYSNDLPLIDHLLSAMDLTNRQARTYKSGRK